MSGVEGTEFGQSVRFTFKKIATASSTASVAAPLTATSSPTSSTAPQLLSTRGIPPPQVTEAKEVAAVEEGVAPMEEVEEPTEEGQEDVEVVELHYNLKLPSRDLTSKRQLPRNPMRLRTRRMRLQRRSVRKSLLPWTTL